MINVAMFLIFMSYYRIWLDAILPVVTDRETSAQEKCLSILEGIILKNISMETTGAEQLLSWNLLELIAGESGQELRYIVKQFLITEILQTFNYGNLLHACFLCCL